MKKIGLLTQILIAFVIAIILGAIVGPGIEVVKPLGDLFLRLIKFIIVPLVLASLVVGVAVQGTLSESVEWVESLLFTILSLQQ